MNSTQTPKYAWEANRIQRNERTNKRTNERTNDGSEAETLAAAAGQVVDVDVPSVAADAGEGTCRGVC